MVNLLSGTDGRKMSSSWGNTINLTDEPNDMFGKVMSILDSLIIEYFTLCTKVSLEVVDGYKKQLEDGSVNPRDIKVILAKEIVAMYYDEALALAAAENFDKVHKDKEIPDEMPELALAGEIILKVLTESGIAKSAGEAKRLIDQNGVKIDGKVVETYDVVVAAENVVQSGKRNFIRIK